MTALKVNKNSYKIGLDEIEGLQGAMIEVLSPLLERIKESVYWDSELAFEPTEYRSRDGFMPFSSNCGGMEYAIVVPKCEESNFSFLQFGECDECDKEVNEQGEPMQCGYQGQECAYDNDGYNDAMLRVWLKFEGLTNGTMKFYLILMGGNEDAPYFRKSSTYFESEFQAKTLAEFKRKAKSEIAKLMKVMK